MAIDWTDYGIYDNDTNRHLPTDWIEVVYIGHGGYNWTEFYAFWSPVDKMYYWDGDSGCSCRSWGDGIRSKGSFQVGKKADLKNGIKRFAADYEYSVTGIDAINAVATVSRFDEKKRSEKA